MNAMKPLAAATVLCCAASLLTAQTPSAQMALSPPTLQHIDKVTSCLHPDVQVVGEAKPCVSLAKRMQELHIPGVSIAVMHDGKVEWAKGFGLKQLGGEPITADTLFQAGSISKPVAALAALHQVQEKKLALDADINTELTSWKLPSSPAANGKPVTLRELLTHTAGLTVHGFPGYATTDPVPTLVQVLDGEKPANTKPIRIETEPGSKWNYSGGGFTIMQQAVIDGTKQPFPKLLQETVLTPIGMRHSSYQQPLPKTLQSSAAVPYDRNGTAVPGGAHTYPEMAAAGLWTTPSDILLYCMEVQHSLKGKANHVLSQSLTEQMLTPGLGHWGLGLQIGGSSADPYFSHGGVNEGFESFFLAYEHHGDGVAIMTNAQGGGMLAHEIAQSIADEYGWPDFRTVVHSQIKVDPALLGRYVGTYELFPSFSIAITQEGDQLMSQATNQPKVPIFPESPTKFFLKVTEAEMEFFPDDKGQVPYFILHQGGQDIKAIRK